MSTEEARDEPRNKELEERVKSVVFGNKRPVIEDGHMRAPPLPDIGTGETTWPVRFKKTREGAEQPTKGTPKSGAYDVYAAEDVTVQAGEVGIVPLGFSIALPAGYDLKILSRSGNPKKRGLFIANSVGLVDEDYRDEVGVLVEYKPDNTYKAIKKLYKALTTFVLNLTSAQQFVLDDAKKRLLDAVQIKTLFPPLEIKKGERIAQVQINKVVPFEFVEVDELDETERTGGFGSTGV